MGNWPACLHYTGVQHCCSSHKLLYLPVWNPWAFYEEGDQARLLAKGSLVVIVLSASCASEADGVWQAELIRYKETAVNPKGPWAICREPTDPGFTGRAQENMYSVYGGKHLDCHSYPLHTQALVPTCTHQHLRLSSSQCGKADFGIYLHISILVSGMKPVCNLIGPDT